MRQLTGHDASVLDSDTLHANANVTYVQIYDQRTAPGGKLRFKSILAHIESRLHLCPLFRNKLLRVPFELDYPYWIEDEHFNLEHHVRHIALPKPGDWRQFCIQASRIHARALDLNRPLWEIYVVEGLDSFDDLPVGSFALLTKVHRAAVDVASRAQIVEVLHDTTRRPPKPAPPQPWFPQEPPGAFALTCLGAVKSMLAPWKLMNPLLRFAPAALAFASEVLRPTTQPTATRFNAVVSPHRVFDTRRFMQSEFDSMRALVAGATRSDAVLAVCAGGLRRYLLAHAELPQDDLAAIAPIGIADAGSGAETETPPELRWLRVRLGTHLADPVQRLAWIHRQTSASQAAAPAVAATEQVDATPGMQLASCTISPVPGPCMPLFLHGARMTYFSAILPISDGMGLVFAVTSYDGRIVISPTSCRELMPDPQAFTQCLRDSFQELLALARPAPAAKPRARSGSKSGAKSAPLRASASDTHNPKRRTVRTDATALAVGKAVRRRSTAPRR
jgi:WS/DGAT/MGAT family acyltransferase